MDPREEASSRESPTVRLAVFTGVDDVGAPDPTEDYHEASRMYPGATDPFVVGGARLEREPELRLSTARSVKRYWQRPFTPLPQADLRDVTLADALAARRSSRSYGPGELRLEELATLLHAAYGITGGLSGTTQLLRTAPSGGALYPLELYVVAHRVEGVEEALYHYDPVRHGLELIRPLGHAQEIAAATPYHDLLAPSAAVVVITAVFWRSRFKYGARAYRFALLEAGHAAQSYLLAAAGLGLATVPVGGFYDRRVDAFLDVDGLHEASLYLLPVGRS